MAAASVASVALAALVAMAALVVLAVLVVSAALSVLPVSAGVLVGRRVRKVRCCRGEFPRLSRRSSARNPWSFVLAGLGSTPSERLYL